MAKRSSSKKLTTPPRLVDPLSWLNGRNYGELKNWLREATQQRIFLPLVIPHDIIPVSYLAQLLTRADARIKTHLRTIIPELIKEWGTHDDRDCLDDLLILCGYLNCNEAEIPISRIITEKLADEGRDIELRRRALSVLQAIGTDKSLHLFKRYIGDYDYAAVCYRSLYMLNLEYAVTEFEDVMKLYQHHGVTDELEDVAKVLFKYTLKSPQYIFVLQPLIDQLSPELLVEVVELLTSIDVLNKEYLAQLSSKAHAQMIKQIMQRSREEDFERISTLLDSIGVKVDPPAYRFLPDAAQKTDSKAKGQKRFFLYDPNKAREQQDIVPLITTTDLGQGKSWVMMREFLPDDNLIMSALEH